MPTKEKVIDQNRALKSELSKLRAKNSELKEKIDNNILISLDSLQSLIDLILSNNSKNVADLITERLDNLGVLNNRIEALVYLQALTAQEKIIHVNQERERKYIENQIQYHIEKMESE